jgi:hypothetical protein
MESRADEMAGADSCVSQKTGDAVGNVVKFAVGRLAGPADDCSPLGMLPDLAGEQIEPMVIGNGVSGPGSRWRLLNGGGHQEWEKDFATVEYPSSRKK